jgi:hypothetical protein
MSEYSPEQENEDPNAWGDSWEGGGFFADSGVKVEDVADDPFNFGNGYHIIAIKEWRQPKVSPTGKFGSYFVFEYMEPKYEKLRGFGRWYQIPTPKAIQDSTGNVFDPENNPDDMTVASNFKKLLWAVGHNVDQMNQARPKNTIGRPFLTRLKAVMNEESGYWEIRFSPQGLKRMPEPGTEEYNALMAQVSGASSEGMNEFAQPTGNSASSGGISAAERAMRDEVEGRA